MRQGVDEGMAAGRQRWGRLARNGEVLRVDEDPASEEQKPMVRDRFGERAE
jgi:hypothetical protein